MMLKKILLLLLIVGLLSCSEPQSNSNEAAKKDSKNPSKHMLSDQQKMIQKAKDTEKLIKEADAKRRKAVKDQSG